MRLTGAGDDDFDGIPYTELDFSVVIWSPERRRHIEERSRRKGSPNEVDILETWTVQAIADTQRIVRNGRSRDRLSVQVIGHSPAAGRVLAIYLRPHDRPPRGTWYGATARVASPKERQEYERHQP